jgi:OFA family oxalate/formate antiporter-like MFS transporter
VQYGGGVMERSESLGSDDSQLQQPRVFFGWWVVFAATGATFLHGSVYLYGLGALFTPIREDTGWSRGEISIAISLATLAGGLAGPFAGSLIDRYGPRVMQLYATASLGLGFILLSAADSLFEFYAVFLVFMGVAYAIGGIGLAPIATVANWFVRKRRTALGIAATGWGPGGIVWPLVIVAIVPLWGWQWSAVAAGALIWVLGTPLALLLRHRPERYGLLPDGDTPEGSMTVPSGHTSAPSAATAEPDFRLGEALRTPAFWLLTLTLSLGFMVTPAIGLHQIPFLIESGYEPVAAAAVLGGMTMLSIPGRLVFGWLGDRYDMRLLVIVSLLLQTAGLLVLVVATQLWHLLAYAVIFGTGFGGLRPLSAALPASYFGRTAYASIRGAASSVQVGLTMAAPVLTGVIADATGSYATAFAVLAAINTIGALTAFAMRPPSPRSTAPTG